MAELKLIVNNTESADANMPLRWCANTALIDQLKKRRIDDPHVVIVVAYENTKGLLQESSRYVVPITQLMQYVVFSRPGKHRVFACIIDGTNGRRAIQQKFFEKTFEGGYKRILISEGLFTLRSNDGATELEVVVAEKFFGKLPTAKEMNWLTWCLSSVPKNQCELRKRRIHAYSWQPFLYAIFWALVFVAGWFLQIFTTVVHMLCLRRGINWLPNIFPWRIAWFKGGEVFHPNLGRSMMFADKDGREYKHSTFWLLFVPIFPVSIFFMSALLYRLGWLLHSWRSVCITTLILFIALPVIIVAVLLLAVLADCLMAKTHAMKLDPYEAYYNKLAPLVSCGNKPEASINALPAQRRTIHLRLQQIKARVCRPLPQ